MPERLRLSATDGFSLAAAVFGKDARGPVVIVNGATGVRQQYYWPFSEWLARRDCTVLTWDYRGVAGSRPHRLRGFQAQMRDWGQLDFEGVLRYAAERWPGRPLTAVGHSIGGQILGFPESNVRIARAVTIAAQSGWYGHWEGKGRLAMAALWFVGLPAVASTVGYIPGWMGMGEDVPAGVAREWARWGRKRDFFTADGIGREGFQRFQGDLMMWSLDDDTYAPRRAVDWLAGLFPEGRVTRRHATPEDGGAKAIGHFGFFRGTFRETLWPEAARFLLEGATSAAAASEPQPAEVRS